MNIITWYLSYTDRGGPGEADQKKGEKRSMYANKRGGILKIQRNK
jgi:hypothetical protein